ncbi:MAG: DsrE/DsrF/TusD sulfur relay family protein [Candidatus Ranarchaeia archaeon]|jgi:sulfur relay (sulfurtransferase) complex TusBCD TusD component (DsrE family)
MKRTIIYSADITEPPAKVWKVLTQRGPKDKLLTDVVDAVGVELERHYKSWKGEPLKAKITITQWELEKQYGYESQGGEADFSTVFYLQSKKEGTKVIQIRDVEGTPEVLMEQDFQVKRYMAKLKEDVEQKKKLGFLLVAPPYSSESPDTVLRLANAALDKGYNVFIEMTVDAATNVISSMKPFSPRPDYPLGKEGRNISKLFEQLRAKGAMVSLCAIHANHRGINPKTAIKNMERGGLAPFSLWLQNCDKVFTFSH